MYDHRENPSYPKLGPTVQKWRNLASQRPLDREERLAYGEAVHRAFIALRRPKASSEANFKPQCASGTWHNNGDAIHEAVRKQNIAAFWRAVKKDGARRTPDDWQRDYDFAMKEKRDRAQS